MSKTTTWILVADSTKARVFKSPGPNEKLSDTLVHEMEGSNLRSRDIDSDRPGRTFDSGGQGRHAQEPPTDPHRHAKHEFARELTHYLEHERTQGAYDALIVVAPPQFLGDLRSTMSDNVRKLVSQEINKDLSMLPAHELEGHLETLL